MMRLETEGGSQALDLDTGLLLNIPDNVKKLPESEAFGWMARQGADLAVEQVRGRWGLITPAANELQLTAVPNDLREKRTPISTARSLFDETIRRGNMVVHVLSTNVQPPLTFTFQTGAGGKGLLQITSFGEDPDQASLQLKRQR